MSEISQVLGRTTVVRDADTNKFIALRDDHGNDVVTAADFATAASVSDLQATVVYETTVNTVAPVITPGAGVAGTVEFSCTTGTWSHLPLSYAYQWQADAVDIPDETANTYTTVVGDAGKEITCVVTATNVKGAGSPVSSNGVTPS
jgi:hypothetical protein